MGRAVLDAFLTELLSEFGFRRIALLELEKPCGDAVAKLSWPCRTDPRGFAAFTAIVSLRFAKLNRWFAEDGPLGLRLVWSPIHLLRKSRDFSEWKFSDAADLQTLRGQVVSDVAEVVVPWFDKWSSLASVGTALESTDQKCWVDLGFSPETRVIARAAILLTDGDKPDAIKLLDDTLAERKGMPAMMWFDIERMRRRVAES